MNRDTSMEMTRRQLIRLMGGATLAAGAQAWLPPALWAQAAGRRPPGALDRFHTPARIRDLPDPAKQALLDEAWNINANGWTQQAILGNPWNALYQGDQTYYYNPLETDLTHSVQTMISWPAFPNRILYYYSNLTQQQQWEIGDTGTVGGKVLGNITQGAQCAAVAGQPLGPYTPTTPFPPYGPRGWLDEYCEMSIKRNQAGKIVRIDFACENPEYWYTLWSIDPDQVAEIYRQTLGNKSIKREDLELSVNGRKVIDPATGRAAYNPLNKWNSGTQMTADAGGVMHLTSTPNTIQTELQLAGGATVQRLMGNENATQLICCGEYGQIYRNSDPHIGQLDNQVVGAGYRVSLADPIGLYIQMPDLVTWAFNAAASKKLPAGASPSECFQIVRGAKTLAGFPPSYNFILHAKLEIPEAWAALGVTVEDINIDGLPITYGSQILQSIRVALFPLAVPAEQPAPALPCVSSLPNSTTGQPDLAYPQQILFEDLWDAYYNVNYTVPYRQCSPGSTGECENGTDVTMSLASNTIVVAPRVRRGTSVRLALLGSSFYNASGNPAVEFVDPETQKTDKDIQVMVVGFEQVFYTVPGNSEPGPQQLLRLWVDVGSKARLGQRDVRVTNAGAASAEAAKFFLWIVA